jgi:hypothetical protein
MTIEVQRNSKWVNINPEELIDVDLSFCFLPQGYECDIHTVTKVKLDYVSNGIRYPKL